MLFRSGELTPVWVPDDAHEAMRDLCRARQAAREVLRRARQQVLSFLLRHGRVYSDGGHWSRKYRLWLSAQRFDHPARQIAFEELVQAVEEAQARREKRAAALRVMAKHAISQRRARQLASVDPKTVRRERVPDCPEIRRRMRDIASERHQFGYRRIGLMLAREGMVMNHKKLRRLYREEGLAVKRRRGRKRATGT